MRVIAFVLVLLAASRTADAYPQFQLSSGADTCKQCHFSPAGGGLINDYGRDEAGSTLSTKEGNGGFLHGAWTPPASFQVGGDVRLAGGFRHNSANAYSETLAFPMQMELYLRPQIGPVSLYVNVGAYGSRTGGIKPNSREHYVMYEPEGSTWYARAGRFFPVFGVRTADHTAYPRRHLDMYVYDEPYGASWGRFGASSELHVSLFAPTPGVLGTANDFGGAVYYERRNEDATGAYAAQARVSASASDRRALVGTVVRRWSEGKKLMLLAEADAGIQAFADSDQAPRYQALGYLGATYFLEQGLLLGAVVQAYDEDVLLKNTTRQAAEINLQWFLVPHVELHLLTRAEAVGVAFDEPVVLILGQLHYYL